MNLRSIDISLQHIDKINVHRKVTDNCIRDSIFSISIFRGNHVYCFYFSFL